MSIAKRLFNVARAEVGSVFKGKDVDPAEVKLEAEFEELRRKAKATPKESKRTEPRQETPRPRSQSQTRAHDEPTKPVRSDELARWYANLELPYGAPLEEVRAAYRRMMRRYHPDRHRTDPTSEAAAAELVMALREAHDGLIDHLTRR
ncbi:MAG: DnaJ domain-containing protein [Deltaproteobacteria bacterium]|nr:DnaJ domain-containing protein [Deltaproteobacteria bacterium]